MKKQGRTNIKTIQKKNISLPKKNVYILFLTIIIIVVFAQSTNFEFVNIDDKSLIYENPLVTDPSIPYSQCFQQFLYSVYYKPVVFLTWKAEHDLFGSSASHFHLINWLLHLCNTILLFFIGSMLFRRMYSDERTVILSSFLLALLFSINPLRIESVAWATERKDVLFSFFFLSSWLLYIKFIQTNRYLFVVAGCLLYFLSGLSKSMALPLIVILFLTDYWYNRDFKLKRITEKLPYFLALVSLLALYGLFNSHASSNTPVNIVKGEVEGTSQLASLKFLNGLPFLQYISSVSTRILLSIIHSFIPVKLSIIYPHDKIYGFFGWSIVVLPVVIAALVFWAWKSRNKNRYFFTGIIFFMICLSPVLAQSSTGQAIFLSDRYTYIPSIGLFLILVPLINNLQVSKTQRSIIFAAICLFYFLVSMVNINNWKNSESLFAQALKVYPESALAHLNLGLYYREQNNYEEALSIYSEGIKNNPGYLQLYVNRSRIYLDRKDVDHALDDLNKCLSLDPLFSEALVNRGVAYGMKGDLEKSLVDLNKALELEPNNASALTNRSFVYYNKREYEKSSQDIHRYLETNPNDADYINLLGLCHLNLNDPDKAIPAFSQAIQLKGNESAFFLNRSLAYNKKNDTTNALKDALKAQELGKQVDASYIQYLKSK